MARTTFCICIYIYIYINQTRYRNTHSLTYVCYSISTYAHRRDVRKCANPGRNECDRDRAQPTCNRVKTRNVLAAHLLMLTAACIYVHMCYVVGPLGGCVCARLRSRDVYNSRERGCARAAHPGGIRRRAMRRVYRVFYYRYERPNDGAQFICCIYIYRNVIAQNINVIYKYKRLRNCEHQLGYYVYVHQELRAMSLGPNIFCGLFDCHLGRKSRALLEA